MSDHDPYSDWSAAACGRPNHSNFQNFLPPACPGPHSTTLIAVLFLPRVTLFFLQCSAGFHASPFRPRRQTRVVIPTDRRATPSAPQGGGIVAKSSLLLLSAP
jgi:hypothetical protein